MNRYKYSKSKKSMVKNNIGFYISLALCLVAVAGAAWSTYGSIMEYNYTADNEVSIEEKKAQVNGEVSNAAYKKQESSKSTVTKKAQESSVVSEIPKPVSAEVSMQESKPEESSKESSAESSSAIAEPIENGKVIKGFSPKDPIRSETMNDWRIHSGTDISCNEGAPVHAIMAGTVKMLYKDTMLGNAVIVEHSNGYESRYYGMTDSAVVKAGDIVSAGDTLGYAGQIPSESKDEEHIHIEVLLDGKRIDPTLIFRADN